ncbi:dynein axonemal assembly factor 3 [Callorhinchus milii]|uniref:dynein axonemal assembly factor 3 n=1 Tax=Callorhinchus milii TaxID=7868 RepID=UPI001C3F813C|nr:dynein axonemal assembly factor 3 [Callorhinchus milii]
MTACGTGDGFGSVTWWGFSPAMDFQKESPSVSTEALGLQEGGLPELNILMVGAGDSRHLLTTLCRAHRWAQRKINFYIVENNLELIGRHLLFLSIALERSEQMGLQEKSELLLELFGNSLIRSQTAAYLQEKANLFIRYVTDPDYLQEKMPLVDLSALKFKERDLLEGTFKFWRNPDQKVFQINKLWDLRNRKYLGIRYDSRKGVYDWDLHMKLHERGAVVINNQEYFRWREQGFAFEVREGVYDVPNKTLASGLLVNHKGEKVAARGFWGDIVTSPFIAFGIETEEKSLLKTANGIHVKTAQNISHYNITALFHELVTREKYSPMEQPSQATLCEIFEEEPTKVETANDPHNTKNKSTDNPEEQHDVMKEKVQAEVQENKLMGDKMSEGSHSASEYDYLPLPHVKIHFLPLNCVPHLHKKSKYTNLFNVIYFSCSMLDQLKPELKQTAAPQATLLVEMAKFLLDIQKDLTAKFASRATEIAEEAGFVPFGTMNGEESFARFELKVEP